MSLFHYPSQTLQDYLSQRWVMAFGRRVDPADIPWLMGPFGDVDVIADHYVDRLARDENLVVERRVESGGLIDSMDPILGPEAAARLHPRVRDFYERTARYHLDAWSEWKPLFRPFAGVVHILYSRRLNQLNLPLSPLDTARGLRSEIIKLRERAPSKGEGEPDALNSNTSAACNPAPAKYTIWFRTIIATGRVIYSGIYTATTIPPTRDHPHPRPGARIIFPLPRGNATVIMRSEVDARGGLHLVSDGRRFGDPGFYFLLRDKRGRHYSRFIASLHERVSVYVNDDGELRADHTFDVWGMRALTLHYKISEKTFRPESPRPVGAVSSVA